MGEGHREVGAAIEGPDSATAAWEGTSEREREVRGRV